MKKFGLAVMLIGAISLTGCTAKNKENSHVQVSSEETARDMETSASTNSNMDSSSSHEESVSSSSTADSTLQTTSEETNPTTESGTDPLSHYTDDQIEYARIWLQLGTNQEIDTLDVQKIPAGTPIVPSIPDSAVFPEDVIQLSGGRRVDGSVTYGSNHNGTINVYNVPINLYWEFYAPNGTLDVETLKAEAQKVLTTTQLVSVAVGDPTQVKRLIGLENYTDNIILPN
jgi:hypothetical protein